MTSSVEIVDGLSIVRGIPLSEEENVGALTLGGYLMLGPGEGPVERPMALEPITAHGVRMLRRKSPAPGEVRS